MGTQFTSRYTQSDRKRILEGIETARQSVAPTKTRDFRRRRVLVSAQVRKYGDETVGQVLAVANKRGFLPLSVKARSSRMC